MTKRTCSLPECDKPHRARGLCGTHYNQQNAPDRHKKKLTACVVCGTVVEKASGGGRKYGATCSNECRRSLQGHRAPRTRLPPSHPAIWYGASSPWPKGGWGQCGWCDQQFPRIIRGSKYCSRLCNQRSLRGVMMAQSQLDARVRQCAQCGQDYTHARANRLHCSDLCRDLARKARGVELYHGWISTAERQAIYQRDGYACWLCGDPVDMGADQQRDDWAASLDHVLPRSKGGTHEADNLKTAHRWCNSIRSDQVEHDLFAA